jgi:hypothetical protein
VYRTLVPGAGGGHHSGNRHDALIMHPPAVIFPRGPEENRRHKRLMTRAAKLDMTDLFELAAGRNIDMASPTATGAPSGFGLPSAGAGAAGDGASAVPAAPALAAVVAEPGRHGASEGEPSDEEAHASQRM